MSIEVLTAAATPSDDDESSLLLELLRQQPETGGKSGEDLADETNWIEALSAEQVTEVREKLETATRMESRTPRYVENLRQQAVDICPTLMILPRSPALLKKSVRPQAPSLSENRREGIIRTRPGLQRAPVWLTENSTRLIISDDDL